MNPLHAAFHIGLIEYTDPLKDTTTTTCTRRFGSF